MLYFTSVHHTKVILIRHTQNKQTNKNMSNLEVGVLDELPGSCSKFFSPWIPGVACPGSQPQPALSSVWVGSGQLCRTCSVSWTPVPHVHGGTHLCETAWGGIRRELGNGQFRLSRKMMIYCHLSNIIITTHFTAPPRRSEVSPMLPLNQFQCWSNWPRPCLVLLIVWLSTAALFYASLHSRAGDWWCGCP